MALSPSSYRKRRSA